MKKTTVALLLTLCFLGTCFAAAFAGAAETTIAYPADYNTNESGASSYNHIIDHKDSLYFAHPDIFNMEPTETLAILPRFKTYQQTTEWSCGNATALMVMAHFGKTDDHELSIAKVMGSNCDLNGNNTEQPGLANEEGEWGTSTAGIVKYFESIGWDVQSSLTAQKDEGGRSFPNPADFTGWVVENLRAGVPVMVEWIDWGGHWQAIIGYDTMGTETFGDDVLLLADPYDTSDQLQDGYYIVPAERFFYMWFDARVLPADQKVQQWVIAKPQGK